MFPSKKTTIALAISMIAAAAFGGLGATNITTTVNAQVPGMTTSQGNTTTTQQQSTPATAEGTTTAPMSDTVTLQKTGVSDTDPLPGHSGHQLVMALAPRSDGKVWVGTVTWTASKPVEVVVLHGYNSSVTADAAHGQPLTAPFGNGVVAISLIKTASGTPVASGTMPFAGNALAFHTLSGDKFTVTYTVDATAKQASSSLPSSP